MPYAVRELPAIIKSRKIPDYCRHAITRDFVPMIGTFDFWALKPHSMSAAFVFLLKLWYY